MGLFAPSAAVGRHRPERQRLCEAPRPGRVYQRLSQVPRAPPGHYPEAKIVCVVGPSLANETWQKWQADVRTVVNRQRANDPQVYYFGISNFELHGSDSHPNLDEHRKVAGELTPFLRDLMAW